ncbi:MAG: sigma-54-dependent Fis family transcriptional regulator [Bacteroidales bacterium]|nr:sigma-54-dependent Fis family transcriptional regulator [Bacteroidales bacterium]
MEIKTGRILAIDDNQEILLSLRVVLSKHLEEIKLYVAPSDDAIKEITSGSYDVVLLDMNFTPGSTSGKEGLDFLKKIISIDPSISVVMITAYGDVNIAVEAMKYGATDFVLKPWENKKLLATVLSAYNLSKSKRESADLRQSRRVLANDIDTPYVKIIGESEPMKKVMSDIEKVAKTDANVLVLGENGTGKELVARAIHRISDRASQLFVSVDMGAIPDTLFESELFGCVKGAYTDARENRPGRFEMSSGGTLFLDEIANIPLTLQAKLLGVLQTKQVSRLGSVASKDIDIRLISATNASINQMINEGKFRQDLYYRINTIEITIPPLRERGDDILLLANHYLDIYSRKYGKRNLRLSKAVQRLIHSYNWPGNVRELAHSIERAVIMTDGAAIEPDSILFAHQNPSMLQQRDTSLHIDEVEKQTIIKALKVNDGNISTAALELGMGRTTLYRKMAKYGI